MLHDIMCCLALSLILTEVDLAYEEVSDWPDPFGTLVIIVTASLIIVVIVALILSIGGIKGLNAHRSFSHEDLFDDFKAVLGLTLFEKIRGYCHCNAKVWSKLVVCKALG